MDKFGREIDGGIKFLGMLTKIGWATGVSIGNNIHRGRLEKAIEQERARKAGIKELDAREEKASEARIAKYESIMLRMLDSDLC
jgi:hypothetical protein